MIPQEHGAGNPYPVAGAPRHIYINGRVVGHVTGNTFHKSIKGSVHLLRKPPAIAFDVSSLDDAQAAGAIHVEVTDTETNMVYRAPIIVVMEEGRRLNRGYGEQIFLTLDRWQRPNRDEAEQLGLSAEEVT